MLLDFAARCAGDRFVFARKAMGRSMTILVSVVVPTYKRPELLRRCLAALLAQDYDPRAYEIIVADDAACDVTRQLVERLCLIHEEYEDCLHLRLSIAETKQAASFAGLALTPQPLLPIWERGCRRSDGDEGAEINSSALRYLPVTGAHGPAAARNAGWRAARGAIVAFTDDDCMP